LRLLVAEICEVRKMDKKILESLNLRWKFAFFCVADIELRKHALDILTTIKTFVDQRC
jgi:hypothetical protein